MSLRRIAYIQIYNISCSCILFIHNLVYLIYSKSLYSFVHSLMSKYTYWSNVAWVSYLGYAEQVITLQCFKSDNHLSLCGNIEGHHSGALFIFSLFAICCGMLCRGIQLARHISGEFTRGLVVFGTAACMRLL